jgi:hypothetical protein
LPRATSVSVRPPPINETAEAQSARLVEEQFGSIFPDVVQ